MKFNLEDIEYYFSGIAARKIHDFARNKLFVKFGEYDKKTKKLVVIMKFSTVTIDESGRCERVSS
jgi:hypothetical protein